MSKKLFDTDLKFLMDSLGVEKFKHDESSLNVYGKDWTNKHLPKPCAIFFPTDVHDVSKALSICNNKNIKIVPSGGRTGLSGGCVAARNELVISLEKLNKVGEVDPIEMTIHAEAGVITEALQEKCDQAGFFFPIDLAAKGSSQLGGNIATNAGGLKVIRYGNTRENVVGLQVVLANGEILDLDKRLVKDNSGYDLKQLFIGSEGTLGVVTAATIKIMPKPNSVSLCCIAINDFSAISTILAMSNKQKLKLSAFEFMTKECLKVVLNNYSNLKSPTSESSDYYLLMEFENTSDEEIETFFSEIFDLGLVVDATIPTNSQETSDIWSLREFLSESISTYPFVKKNDVSVRVGKISELVMRLNKLIHAKDLEGIELLLFGHIGDGNVHINYASKKAFKDYDDFSHAIFSLEEKVSDLLIELGGSISAEHGIGLLKKEQLKKFKPSIDMNLMKGIKKVFDPQNIMNPGKILDIDE